MDANNNILKFAVIAIIVLFIVRLLFKKSDSPISVRAESMVNSPRYISRRHRKCMVNTIPVSSPGTDSVPKKEGFESNSEDNSLYHTEDEQSIQQLYDHPIKIPRKSYKFVDYDDKTAFNNFDATGRCPLKFVEGKNNLYMQNFLNNTQEEKIKPAISRKQFHNDFFGFRDLTEQNSSIRQDPVDLIQQMYLDGNLGAARRFPNMKIKDIFDAATQGPNLYERQCVRLPHFDNINFDGYLMSNGSPGLMTTRTDWEYDNEKIMNGGKITDYQDTQNLYPHDNEYENQMPVVNYDLADGK